MQKHYIYMAIYLHISILTISAYTSSLICAFCGFDLCIYRIWKICIKYINNKWINSYMPIEQQTSVLAKTTPSKWRHQCCLGFQHVPVFLTHYKRFSNQSVTSQCPVTGDSPTSLIFNPLPLPRGPGWRQKMPIWNENLCRL